MQRFLTAPLWIAVFSGIIASSQAHNASSIVYLTQVEKSFHAPNFERFAGPDFSVMVSSYIPDDKDSVAVTLGETESLAFVELHHLPTAILPGEVGRFGRLAFIKIAKQMSPLHLDVGNERNHVRVIDTTSPEADDFDPTLSTSFTGDHFATLAPHLTPLVPKETLLLWLQELSGEKAFDTPDGTRKIIHRGSDEGRKLARQWLAQKYTALGFKVSEHNYGSGTNFIADRTGKDPTKVFIISAHLDSKSNAGADDDGAGTISALAIAAALSQQPLKYSLRILGFDQEELGLVGSKAYAKKLKTDNTLNQVVGVLNLEMTAYDGDKDFAFHAIHCNENKSKDIADAIATTIKNYQIGLKVIPACTEASDHASFWQYGVPAIVISENFFGPQKDGNPCYHKACDKVNILNFEYMHRLTTAAAITMQDALATPVK